MPVDGSVRGCLRLPAGLWQASAGEALPPHAPQGRGRHRHAHVRGRFPGRPVHGERDIQLYLLLLAL